MKVRNDGCNRLHLSYWYAYHMHACTRSTLLSTFRTNVNNYCIYVGHISAAHELSQLVIHLADTSLFRLFSHEFSSVRMTGRDRLNRSLHVPAAILHFLQEKTAPRGGSSATGHQS